MVMPSPPLTFVCRNCGWKKTHPMPVSDCRIPGFGSFSCCPECGLANMVEARRATALEVASARLSQMLRRR